MQHRSLYIRVSALHDYAQIYSAVYNHWTGLLGWTTGTGLTIFLEQDFPAGIRIVNKLSGMASHNNGT